MGNAHDEPDLAVVASGGAMSDAGGPAVATLSGTAADLDCWIWHRPSVGQVERAGDPLVLGRLDEIIARDSGLTYGPSVPSRDSPSCNRRQSCAGTPSRSERLTAEMTALSEAITMLASRPTPHSTRSPSAHST